MSEVIVVGMADFKVGKAPAKLMTAGLGSCIGICVYDHYKQVAGLAHIMLPSFEESRKGNPAKYADTCLEMLLENLLQAGAAQSRLKAKIAGGAQMFSFGGKTPLLKIGERNAEAVKQELQKSRIPLLAADVGGTYGRTIHFEAATGDLMIRSINQGQKVI